MGFQEVQSLDAETTIAIGKKDKATGKMYPKQAEGYYLGNRSVETKKGEAKLHFLQTPKGNLGVWGTTDLDRKLTSSLVGTMVRITFVGMKSTKNGDMYSYKVEHDDSNKIEVTNDVVEFESDAQESTDSFTNSEPEVSDEDVQQAAELLAAERAAKAAKVQEILNRGKGKKA